MGHRGRRMTGLRADLIELSAALEAAGVDELELTGPFGALTLRRPAAGDVVKAATLRRIDICAPAVGEFLACHPMQHAPLVAPGATVESGALLGFLRSGLSLRAVTSPGDGRIVEQPARHGAPFGYGDVLFRMDAIIPASHSAS